MDKNKLEQLIDDDDLGLLAVKEKQSEINHNQRLIESFLEINDFVRTYDREPSTSNEIIEFSLYDRLRGIRADTNKVQILMNHDEFHLLGKSSKKINSIHDIFDDDSLGILDSSAEKIFNLRHIPQKIAAPEYIAQRKPCKNFSDYEHLFKNCHAALTTNKKILRPFTNEQHITAKSFFLLQGILVYVAWVGEKINQNGKRNARLHCIFENGTESDMLLRSLASELYKNGHRVLNNDIAFNSTTVISDDDRNMGYIYILQSLSEEREIRSIKNLYKIGFTTQSIKERIKNAHAEPTYLMAPVSIVATYQCYNLNTQKLERLLLRFFHAVRLHLDIIDHSGQLHTPREWFIVPFDIIEQAINYVLHHQITHYQYNHQKQIIEPRK